MVGVAVALAAFVFSVIAVWQLSVVPEHVYKRDLFTWIPGLQVKIGDGTLANFLVSWGFQLDPLSAVMILVVTGVGSLIHIYSVGYMWDDDGFYRFFAYLNLFMFAMLTLVLGDNFVMMFIGWEGVGLCSYLLIGYYLERKSAGDAAKKAFVVNRIGDFGFILG
ncbi:MAG: NADH-quinone oxidoreductase subunit L, partial [Acidobacteria bacterium]|nr:NADH-quinone oxidoreductase subunit L [Acidobacteriota bacterium]